MTSRQAGLTSHATSSAKSVDRGGVLIGHGDARRGVSIAWIGAAVCGYPQPMTVWIGVRELYRELRGYRGDRAYEELIAPWLGAAGAAYREQLEPLGTYGRIANAPRPDEYWLAIPYALSRLSDVLLLGFQPELDPGTPLPRAHQLHLVTTPWPAVSRVQYLELFTALGMQVIPETGFDPLLHEIVEVDQAADPETPITVIETVWPGLMLGQLVFARAGVRVRAGANRAERGVADRSPLYWTFLRRHRPTDDLSIGWGHNSQWDTDFRRDYGTDDAHYLNVDATGDIDANDPDDEDDDHAPTPLLTGAERRDLLRHRCLLRTPDRRAALDAVEPEWPTGFWPFDWTLTIELPAGVPPL
jgi:hypothetical protein